MPRRFQTSRERYARIYRRIKALWAHVDGKTDPISKDESSETAVIKHLRDLDPDSRAALRDTIRQLPHPAVATPIDIAEVCDQILKGELVVFRPLFDDICTELLDTLDMVDQSLEGTPEIDAPTIGLGLDEDRELQRVVEYLESQTQLLEYNANVLNQLSGLSAAMQQQLEATLKSQCPHCRDDLRAEIDTPANTNDELYLRCYNPNCPGTTSEWKVTDLA